MHFSFEIDESDNPFGLSDAEQLDIALKASLGLMFAKLKAIF
jgi:hypothetical protein